jgi:hypothetical protein
MKLTRKECADIIKRLDTPSADAALSADGKAAIMNALAQVARAMEESTQNMWSAGLNRALARLLEFVLDYHEADSEESILYEVIELYHNLIDGMQGDPRSSIGEASLGALAILAAGLQHHDSEAGERAMTLMCRLFHTVDAKARLKTLSFMAAQPQGKNKSKEEDIATSERCMAMLRSASGILENAKTFGAQIAFCDVLTSLGQRATSLYAATFAPHLPQGVKELKQGRGFESMASDMLIRFNDAHSTRIISLTAIEARLTPDGKKATATSFGKCLVHFRERHPSPDEIWARVLGGS